MIKRPRSGYILILMVTLIPLLLIGIKYLLDTQTLFDRKASETEFLKNNSQKTSEDKIQEKTYKTKNDIQEKMTKPKISKNDSQKKDTKEGKQCAQEAALKVAEKWNPALTYKQQKESMLRIADGIYNGSPTYVETLLNKAIPQIDITKETVKRGGTFDPMRIVKTADSYDKTIAEATTKQVAYKQITLKRIEHNYIQYSGSYDVWAAQHNYNNIHDFLLKKDQSVLLPEEDVFEDYPFLREETELQWGFGWAHYELQTEEGNRSEENILGTRTKTYEIRENPNDPAVQIECEQDKIKVTTDKDIGYAIPAECNVDIILTVPTNTEACFFDEENMKSGNSALMILTDKVKSTPIYQITRAYQKFLKDNFFYTRGVNVGVIPYGGSSIEKSDETEKTQGSDAFLQYYSASLPNINSLNDLFPYQQQAPASNLPMEYYKNYGVDTINPYYVLPLCSDVKFIYGMLGAFYPYRDEKNLSNLIFVSIMLSDNLLQEWNAQEGRSAIDTKGDSVGVNATYGRLSIPSSAEKNRKKVLILSVNKPDWFESKELMNIVNNHIETMKHLTIYDMSELGKKVTQDSCQKLKEKWGENLRIYLIKFHKQDNYLNKNTKSMAYFDYSYLNNCATENTDQYVKDNIFDEAALDKVLRTIANDIKSWTGYTEARNITTN